MAKTRLIQVKLAAAIDKPEVVFLFGSKRVTVAQKKTPIEEADFWTIQTQLPGWIEQATNKKAPAASAESPVA